MAKNGKRRWFRWLVILVVLAAAGVACLMFAERQADQPEFQSAKVARGDLTQAVTATGQLNPVTNVTVGSQISGIIQKLYADWNSLVKAGALVAQLDPASYQARVEQNEGDLANARASLELAQINARRAEELFKDKLISQSEHDQTMANLNQAEAAVKVRAAMLNSSKVDLARCSIYSPIDGVVISRNVDVGQTVAASMNAPVLFLIANDLAKMQINANVSEADIGTVEEGQEATFTVDAFPDRTFTGKVRQIRNSPITLQNVVTYDTVIDVSNPDLKLRPGMTANASIITAQRTGVLRVPNAALRFRPPEPSTNKTFAAKILAKIGLGKETKGAATNAVLVAAAGGTNKVEAAAGAGPPLTGNEPPAELMRRVREMRERGEEVPPEIGAKMRELFQSGAMQRGGGGPGGEGGFRRGGGGGAGARPRTAQPSSRTIYLLSTNTPPGGGEPVPVPQAARVRTGISDGAYTEVTDGLKEGDVVITAVKQPPNQTVAAPPPGSSSPFGGGGFRGR